jgi:hypothetical protein
LSFASAAAAHDIYVGSTVHVNNNGARKSATTSRCSPLSPASSSAAAKTPPPPPETPNRTPTAAEAAKNASATKTFPKSAVYDMIGGGAIFHMRDEAQHRARLKRIAHIYAPGVLHDMEPLMRGELALLLAALEQRRGVAVNVMYWFRMMAFDVMGKS